MMSRLCFVFVFTFLIVSCGNNRNESIDQFVDYDESGSYGGYELDTFDVYEDEGDTYSEDYDYGGLDGDQLVYVCTGPYSDAFHVDQECDGLWNCSEEIIVVDVETAVVDMERHPCSFCIL